MPLVWVSGAVLQLPTPSGSGEAISITAGHLVLGVSSGMLVVWDVSQVVAGRDPEHVKCIQLEHLRSKSKMGSLKDDSWIIERKEMVAIVTRGVLCFASLGKTHELVEAPVWSLEENFEKPGWKVTGVTSDQRLICARENGESKLWAIFSVPVRLCR